MNGWETIDDCPACNSRAIRKEKEVASVPQFELELFGIPMAGTAMVTYFVCLDCGKTGCLAHVCNRNSVICFNGVGAWRGRFLAATGDDDHAGRQQSAQDAPPKIGSHARSRSEVVKEPHRNGL